ncbi:MAG TPA: response regulator [Desulfovibrio sp.]|uniref:response regulator n=1 Tax=Desulfovibrio sp. TaxID=885 RepID=UPI002CBECEDE|nr:response regulator [Desulfovibrio sp.]HMM39263.1 response regulator [Desulfovibrio sp.]
MNRTAPVSVILVDDEVSFVTVLAKRLALRGLDSLATTSGPQAIQALRSRDFDVAVLDLKMDRMDGMEVLRLFRQMLPSMRVIMLTSHGGETEARQAIMAGAYDYIIKPCEFEDLLAKIEKAADAARRTRDENTS